MKKKLIFALALSLATTALIGCNKQGSSDSKEETSSQLVPVVDKYTKESNFYSDKPLEATNKVRFHYHRKGDDGSLADYVKWSIWIWDCANGGNGDRYEFATYDDFGVICDVDLSKVIATGFTTTKQIGFIISTVNWTKDIDEDRYLDIKEQAPGGVQEVYLMQGNSKIFDNAEATTVSTLGNARFDSLSQITFTVRPADDSFAFDPKRVSVAIDGQETTGFTVGDYASKKCSITLNKPIDIRSSVVIKYKFTDKFTDEVTAVMAKLYDTEEFINNYTYTGNDLGVTFDNENNPTKTTFKVWAPTSSQITLNIYNSSDYRTDNTKVKEVAMTYGAKGVYSTTVNEDLSGKYYTYTVKNSKGVNEVVDPYAKSAGLNGKRGMVVNFRKINQSIDGWSTDIRPSFGQQSYGAEAIIYEIHVRDMTINPNSGVSEANRGRFLGLTEENTSYTNDKGVKVSTGLSHLKELGITHVQIQPFYDYSSVDESLDNKAMSDTNYNWGYDPLNYNALEGSYSTNPVDGASRIVEFKKMVMTLHKNGIGINMDVVYNHTSGFDTSNFQKLVPNYYYRTSVSGSPSNGSGCGNEFASNRYMGNKFIRESVKFWTDEYHLSGYRFDLMGLIDNQTMIDVYNDNKAIYNDIMVYGEPWTGGDTPLEGSTKADNLSNQKTVQSSLSQSFFAGSNVLVGAFNDRIRNGIKGDNAPGTGWIQGGSADESITSGIKGMFSSGASTISPSQVINYVSCHDNYTLYDHLVQTVKTRDLQDSYTQADAIVMTTFGVTFMQEGEDFMRTKKYEENGAVKYEGNSYKSSDYINHMDYALKAEKKDLFEFYKKLLAFRKDSGIFSVNTRNDVNARLQSVNVEGKNVSYEITSNGETYLIIHAVNAATVALNGNYEIVLSSKLDSTARVGSTIALANNESIILKKA